MPATPGNGRIGSSSYLTEPLPAGIASGLKIKIGAAGTRLLPKIRKLKKDVARLRAILKAIPDTVRNVRDLFASASNDLEGVVKS
jgi:hypothetical protein